MVVRGVSLVLVVVCCVNVATSTVIAAWAYRRRSTMRAATAFAALQVTGALWSLGHLGETLATTLDGKIAMDALQNLPLAANAVASLWLAYDYVGAPRGYRSLAAVAGIGGGCAVVLASGALGLYVHPGARLVGSPPMLEYSFTPFDLVLFVTALGATAVAVTVMLRRFVGDNPLYAAQTASLAAALALPALGTLLAMSMGLHIDGDRDVTPVTFTLASLVAAWGLRRRLFDIAPIARDAVLARLPDPVMVFDRERRLIDANPAAVALLGEPTPELLGRAPDDVLRRFPPLVAALRDVSADEVEVVDDDRWYAAVATTLTDGRGAPIGYTLVLRDVTARKRSNVRLVASVEARTAELAVSEKRFRALFDEVVSLVGLLDRDGRVLAANRASLEMIGAREDAVRELMFWDTPWWTHDPAVQQQLREAVARAAAGEAVRFQTQHRDRDGKRRDIDFSLTPVRDAEGIVVEMIPEGRDVTAINEERARTERLTEQLRQSQKLESIGRLAGGVAHDFNNVLTVIRGNADVLRLTMRGTANPDALAPVTDIIEAADAAAQITRQLLAFSRTQPVVMQPIALADALAPSKRLLGRLLRKDIKLSFELAPALWVRADATQLQQALMNLVLNAQDAMPDGGRLAVTGDETVLDARTCEEIVGAQPGAYVRLAVSDTGTGMDEDTRARIFEPFYTTKPEGKGTGLGLAVVHGAVYQAGGAIAVASEPGRGTTFTVYLPRIEPPVAVASPAVEPPPAVTSTSPRTIALVEDQEPLRRFISGELTRSGYRVHAFGSPAELRQGAASLEPRPDLLLTDIMLPGTNGVDLARAVAPLWAGVRVLFMSGYSADAALPVMTAVTNDMLIAKPFLPSELVDRIERILRTGPAWDHGR